MKDRLLNLLACPTCRVNLRLYITRESQGEVESGQLECSRCNRVYPIIAFIPRFVPAKNYADNFGYQWQRFQQTQLDSYSGIPISRERFFRQSSWSPQELAGKLVLDVGCGAGRFAEVALSCGAEVVALDYSSAVDSCRHNLRCYPALHSIQADVFSLPLQEGRFDYIYCFGVLQHTPDPERAFHSLPGLLKPEGKLAVDIYLKYWGNWLYTKYWLRPFTVRLPWRTLFRVVESAAPLLLRVSRMIARLPVVGRWLRRLIPVANYEGIYPLNNQQLEEIAILDTFDMLAPRYDLPQTPQALQSWLARAGLEDVEVLKVNHLVGRGRRPKGLTALGMAHKSFS